MIEEQIKLNAEELETLRKIHNATAIRQTVQTPGWDIISGIMSDMIARLENQHLNFAANAGRDAYWASGIRLSGALEALKILRDQIAKEIDLNLIPPNRNGNESE